MRAPLSWLKSFTPLATSPTDRAGVADLAADLDAMGLVVEGVETVGQGLADVVVARVLDIAAIEGADRIRKITVDTGAEPLEVVCGAWNFTVGDIVPFAPVGAELPGEFRIERRRMKGVVSNGMICSARELRLGDDHEGIMILADRDSLLPAGVAVGQPVAEYLGFGDDVVFDLAVEPNRPDCLCMLGVARDLAAHYGLPLHEPAPVLTESGPAASELASVAVGDPDLCFRLTGRVMTGVTLVASPIEVQRRLTLAGMRPIDCVVDASNYVLLELGQPTHPYDLDRLGGRGLIARAARRGETLVTLDGATRVLGTRPARQGDPVSGRDCVICDANDVPVGVGGVMGGQSSEIEAGTGAVLLEAALFLPVGVGRTARHLGLRSEASVRFERGVDPGGVERASARVFELVAEAASRAGVQVPVIARGLLDAHPAPVAPVRVSARPARVNALLGTTLSPTEVVGLLEPIGYKVAVGPPDGEALELAVPTFRPDVRVEVDVAEDVARRLGYSRIVRTERRSPFVGTLDEVQKLRRVVRRVLAGLGSHEVWTSSIVHPAEHARAGWTAPMVGLSNPMVAEESVMRASLLPGLVTVLRHNAGHRQPWLRLFEIGDVFAPAPDSSALPYEPERLAVALAWPDDGARSAMAAWRVVADALGIVGVRPDQDHDLSGAGLHSTRSGWLVTGGDAGSADPLVLGVVGEVDPEVIAAFGLPHERIGWLDLDMAALVRAPRRPLEARPVTKYPSSDVDLAFAVDDDVPAWRVEAVLRAAASELCESISLFDTYRGQGVGTGRRSLAYRLRFSALDRTLTDADVSRLRQTCIKAVESELAASLRA
ncbi:MAG: phenylalanine--tRNA ligase subunit beta [Acidimicrobiales bacterium]